MSLGPGTRLGPYEIQSAYFTGDETGNTTRSYDVSSDGRRFLMIKRPANTGAQQQIVIVRNWFEELKRLVPSN